MVTAAAFPPCVLARVIMERRDEGGDMEVEDEVYTVKIFPHAYLSTVPRFQILPNFHYTYITRHPIRTPLIFRDNPIGSLVQMT